MLQDLRHALRSLRKNPGFAVLTVLIMALGIGSTTAVFSVVNAVVLKPLPYRDPGRIVSISTLWQRTGQHGSVSIPDFRDWREQSQSFSAMATYGGGESAIVVDRAAEFVKTATVSPDFFKVFAIEPVGGRTFSADETKPGSSAAVVVSSSFWQNHYGTASFTAGKVIQLADRSLRVVGILPSGFHFPDAVEIWLPSNTIFPESQSRSGHNARAVARLKPEVSVERAQAEMTVIGNRLEKEYPQSNTDKNVAVAPLQSEMVKDVHLMLYLLLGAVGLVLLIACGNVANLLLAKAGARGREIAVRAALGASRRRIVQQLVTENLLLAIVGGAVGLLLSHAGMRALLVLAPRNVPRLAETGIDARVLIFACAASLVACLIFGVAPAIHAARADVHGALKRGAARGMVGGRSALRGALVVSEVALSVVLLAGAGLLIRSFAALQNEPLGFRPENVLIMETSIPAVTETAARRVTGVYKKLVEEAISIPGVASVGASRIPPGTVVSNGTYFVDRTITPADMRVTGPYAIFSVVGPGAFATLGIPLRNGRDFRASDTFDAPFVAIINEALAREAFPNRDPIGHTITNGLDTLKPLTIVGVVGDIRQRGPAVKPEPEIYMPYEQHPRPSTSLRILARTTMRPEQMVEALRRKAHDIAPEMPVKFTTMEARLSENIAAPRFRTLLLAIFAALAVCLAMAGIYGVISYMVSQRTSEIGLRIALGAAGGDVMKMVLSEGARLAAIGLLLGVTGAMAATRLLDTMLFGVKRADSLTYAAVAGIVALVTLAASCVPARRAARVDPLMALRQE